jgi:hypothetical protein
MILVRTDHPYLRVGCHSCCFLKNQIIRFGVLNHLVFLSQNSAVLLVANMSVTVVSCIVATVAKILSRS